MSNQNSEGRVGYEGPPVKSALSGKLDQNNPEIKSITEKLVRPMTGNRRHLDLTESPIEPPELSMLQRVAEHTSINVNDAEAMMEMLPDLKLAAQILVSLIISPKDMMNTELNYSVEESVFDHEASGVLLEKIRNHFDNDHKISQLLPKIIHEALITHGSYPVAILPETSIDSLINSDTRVSLESNAASQLVNEMTESLGFLGENETGTQASLENLLSGHKNQRPGVGRQVSVSLESIGIPQDENKSYDLNQKLDLGVEVFDNFEILKTQPLMDKVRQDRVHDILNSKRIGTKLRRSGNSVGLESQKIDARTLYRQRNYRPRPVAGLTPASALRRESVGHALIMKLPAESVIPVHVPSDPSDHLGYFVVMDETSSPLTAKADMFRENSGVISQMINSSAMGSTLLQQARRRTGSTNDDSITSQEIQQMERIYGDLLERDLLIRLQNGLYGKGVSISSQSEIYRVMLQRTLQNQQTKILYIPAEMMTYFAFDYNRFGVGRSLLSSTSVLGSMRAVLLFSGAMGSMHNSIGRRVVDIQLDPNDQNPRQTVSLIKHEIAKNSQGSFPLRIMNPYDLTSHIQQAGYEFNISGNKRYPEMKVSIEDKQSNRPAPDTDYEKMLRDRQLMGLWLSPETVDASANAEFAIGIASSNMMTTKRVSQAQEILCGHASDYICKVSLASGSIIEMLREGLREFRLSRAENEKKKAQESALAEETKDASTTDPAQTTDTEAAADSSAGDTEAPVDAGAEGSESDTEAGAGGIESYALPPALVKNETEAAAEAKRNGRTVNNTEEGSDEEDDDTLIFNFLRAIRVELPSPDNNKLTAQMDAFDRYSEFLDKTFKPYADPEFLGDFETGAGSEHLQNALNGLKAYYLRKYLRDNNIMPELEDMLMVDEMGAPLLDLMEVNGNHAAGIRRTIGTYLETIAKQRKADDAAIAEIKKDIDDAVGGGDTGSDWGNTGEQQDTGEQDAGDMGDLGDLDEETEQEEVEEEQEEQPAEEEPAEEVEEEEEVEQEEQATESYHNHTLTVDGQETTVGELIKQLSDQEPMFLPLHRFAGQTDTTGIPYDNMRMPVIAMGDTDNPELILGGRIIEKHREHGLSEVAVWFYGPKTAE